METFEILSAPTESSATQKFAEAASPAGNRVSQRSVSQPSTRKRFRDRDRLATRRRIVLLERNASSSRASAATGDFHLFFSSAPPVPAPRRNFSSEERSPPECLSAPSSFFPSVRYPGDARTRNSARATTPRRKIAVDDGRAAKYRRYSRGNSRN